MRRHIYYVYIIASIARALYTGMTSRIAARVWEHKSGTFEGFTSHFHGCRLVYVESFDDVRTAIAREKQIKRWRREKKVALIEQINRDWHDLSDGWYDSGAPARAWSLDSPQKQRLARDDKVSGFNKIRDDKAAGFRKIKDSSKRTKPKKYPPLP